uniref:Rab-GAP TBC domain-containing protein n=1 Tax=Angiostrongylus cantonensis TaxID=6313 RepID=A0A158PAV1_ANGCA
MDDSASIIARPVKLIILEKNHAQNGNFPRVSIITKRTFSITRYDPCTTEERMKSIQSLLAQIYHERSPSDLSRDLPYSPAESVHSDFSYSSQWKISAHKLQTFDIAQLRNEVTTLNNEIVKANQRLVKMLRQKAFYRTKQAAKCSVLSAILMAISQKTSTDSKIRFSLEPLSNNGGVEQWKRSMRAIIRIPGGIPSLIRIKLWSTLADLHIRLAGFKWEQIRRNTLSEKIQPDDNKIHSQILKSNLLCKYTERIRDIGTSYNILFRILIERDGVSLMTKRSSSKFNKDIGYCQGFNVIAALILQVVEYRTDIALKVMIFLIECVLPRGYFDQSLGALSVDLIVMRDLMLQRLPAIIHHLEQLQSSSNACSNHRSSIHENSNEYEPPLINLFSMHWFLTLFTTCLPRNCVMRVWDALMLNGSEILIRTAIALWSKISRYPIFVIYSMAEFPYPGLTELREKHTWNIQPLSTTIKSFRKSVNNVLYDDPSDEEATCIPCSLVRKAYSRNLHILNIFHQILLAHSALGRNTLKCAQLFVQSRFTHKPSLSFNRRQ